jgi:PAS domain S-box-containing protein
MPAAPPGVVDTGAPSFVVFGPESLGFSTPPTDLHLLPDGRILVVSQREIAIGDGGRWETFQQAADQPGFIYAQVAVDDDGRIYAGIVGAIARIDLGEDARWRFVPVVSSPHDDPYLHVVQLPDTWLWYSGGGAVLVWRPGQSVRSAGMTDTSLEQIFALGNEWYASNEPSGSLQRLRIGDAPTLVSSASALASDTVTCSTAFGPGQVLVGTVGSGLRAFDGRFFSDVAVPKILGPGRRINDLCQVGTDLYAAAVDTTGIVFFERGGRIVQVLNRMLDHRLARARRLVYSRDGVLWALLDNAVACVQFPSPISNFEPIFASALSYAAPVRHQGELWVLTDGRLMRGVYSADRYLERFEQDTPPGRFLWAIAETGGRLFATNDLGIFVRDGTGWQQVAAGIINARLGIGHAQSDGQFFYVARGEIGWIQESAGRYAVQRIPVKGLGEVYNAVEDSTGAVWLELGSSRVGRVEFGAGEPTVRFFGKDDGLGEGWVSIIVLDGIVRCYAGRHLLGFDARTQRFAEDRELIRRIPTLVESTGRPARDASGRLWFPYRGAACFVDDTKAGENPPVGSLALGFEPIDFNMESGGVIWMHSRGHLIRFDPRVPSPPADTPRAMITSVQFTESNRRLFTPGPTLGRLRYTDNSLVIHFAAPANPFSSPVTFEVMLEGAETQWVSTGNVGSAALSRLKEGNYVFHVRPVVGGTIGPEARLAFTVQPPWFRTPLAWGLYVLGAVGVVASAAWLSWFSEARQKKLLERVVAERTRELNATNAQLGRQIAETTGKSAALSASEERYRALNAELEQRVQKRTAELSQRNTEIFQERLLLRTLVDNLPICIYAKDTACRKTLANPTDLKNLGCATEADAVGKTDFDFFPKEVADKFVADDQTVLQTGQPVLEREEFFFDKEGSKHWLLTSKLPLRNQSGEIIGLIGIGIDTTSHKQAEEALRLAHDQLQTILDNIPDRIYFKDTSSRFLNLNRSLGKRLGVGDPAQAIGKTDFDFQLPEKAREFYEDEQRIIRTGEPLINKTEKQILQTGEIAWTSTTKVPMRDQAGKVVGVVGINRDITEIKRAEEKLEALNKQMLTLSRSAGMAEVATDVLHNVGNVLNSVNVSAGVLAERLRASKVEGVSKLARLLREQGAELGRFLTEDERGRKVPTYLEQLAEHLEQERAELGKELDGLMLNIDHIKEIVAMQQNYARVSGVVETVELSGLVEDAFKIHGGAYVRHGITVEQDYGKVPTISVDKHKALQILVNLLHNAKYACDAANRPDKRVTVRIMAAGQERVKVVVSDNGVGIAPENLTRVFTQGFTTRKGGHGFGLHSGALGAKELGGSLTVHSDGMGHGATFILELPCQPPQADQKKS